MEAKSKKQGKGNGSGEQTQGTGDGSSVKQVQEQAGQALEAVQQKAGQIVGPLKKLAVSQLDNQKERVVSGLFSVSTVIRQIDDGLREQDQASVAQYGDAAARRLEQFTTYLREHDTSQLLQEVGNVAKRNPAIFVGGALALGLLTARFLKSSGSNGRVMSGAQQPDATASAANAT